MTADEDSGSSADALSVRRGLGERAVEVLEASPASPMKSGRPSYEDHEVADAIMSGREVGIIARTTNIFDRAATSGHSSPNRSPNRLSKSTSPELVPSLRKLRRQDTPSMDDPAMIAARKRYNEALRQANDEAVLQIPTHIDHLHSDKADVFAAALERISGMIEALDEITIALPPLHDEAECKRANDGIVMLCRTVRESGSLEALVAFVEEDDSEGADEPVQRALYILSNVTSEMHDPDGAHETRRCLARTRLINVLMRLLWVDTFEARLFGLATLCNTACCDPMSVGVLHAAGVDERLEELLLDSGDHFVEHFSGRALRNLKESQTILTMQRLTVRKGVHALENKESEAFYRKQAGTINFFARLHHRRWATKRAEERDEAAIKIQRSLRRTRSRRMRVKQKTRRELREHAAESAGEDLFVLVVDKFIMGVVDDVLSDLEDMLATRVRIQEEVSDPGAKQRRLARRATLLVEAADTIENAKKVNRSNTWRRAVHEVHRAPEDSILHTAPPVEEETPVPSGEDAEAAAKGPHNKSAAAKARVINRPAPTMCYTGTGAQERRLPPVRRAEPPAEPMPSFAVNEEVYSKPLPVRLDVRPKPQAQIKPKPVRMRPSASSPILRRAGRIASHASEPLLLPPTALVPAATVAMEVPTDRDVLRKRLAMGPGVVGGKVGGRVGTPVEFQMRGAIKLAHIMPRRSAVREVSVTSSARAVAPLPPLGINPRAPRYVTAMGRAGGPGLPRGAT